MFVFVTGTPGDYNEKVNKISNTKKDYRDTINISKKRSLPTSVS